MINIEKLPFNHFEVNTYVVWDDTNECVLIDVACASVQEEEQLMKFIEQKQLKPVKILLTHAHIDHVVGLVSVCKTFNLPVSMHKDGLPFLGQAEATAAFMGFSVSDEDLIQLQKEFITESTIISFGDSSLKVLETPGHAAGSICFYSKEGQFVVTGDVLFRQSIGRTDLPTGDFNVLMKSIGGKLLTLPENTQVFPGHGHSTTMAQEIHQNPFLESLFQE